MREIENFAECTTVEFRQKYCSLLSIIQGLS